MAEVKWIKIQTDLFDNRKIRQIERLPDGDTLIVIWLKILILAGTVNDGGLVYFTRDIPYTDQLLATEFNRPLPTVQLALTTFQRFGMIELFDDVIHVSNWERYQNVEGLDRVREQTRQRVATYRERQRNVTVTLPVTDCNGTDIDTDKEQKRTDKSCKRFAPPTLDEVSAYCSERGNAVDPQRFVDYYTANGWKVGKNPMKDWKAAVRTWERDKPAKKITTFADIGEAERRRHDT